MKEKKYKYFNAFTFSCKSFALPQETLQNWKMENFISEAKFVLFFVFLQKQNFIEHTGYCSSKFQIQIVSSNSKFFKNVLDKSNIFVS